MGIPSDMMGVWASKRSSFMVAASPNEPRVIDTKTSSTQGSMSSSVQNFIFFPFMGTSWHPVSAVRSILGGCDGVIACAFTRTEIMQGTPRRSLYKEDAVQKGFKMAIIAGSVAAVPTLVGCRVVPWAKANLNYTAQALIISAAAISAFFITADKTILEKARGNTIGKYDKSS